MPQNNGIDIIRRCLDNTAPPSKYAEMGILYFARTFFDRCRESPHAFIHYQMMQNALGLFDPQKLSIVDRQIYITVFREAAKSTMLSYVLPLYLIHHVGGTMAVRIEKDGWEGADVHDYDIFTYEIKPEFIEIFSETHNAAERMTSNIRNELEQNGDLHAIYGKKYPQGALEDNSNVWRRDVFTTPNGFIIYGNGSGQQSRGMLIAGRRPSLAIFDDIYSRKNTLTEDSREKIRYWFYAEALNSVDTINGKAILVGTIVHEDTVFIDVQKQSSWKGFNYPAISEGDMAKALSACSFNAETQRMDIPSFEEIKAIELGLDSIAWKERQGLYYLLSMYRQNYEIGRTSYFYQEKLNILMSPDDMVFTEKMVHFTNVEVFHENGYPWVKFDYDTFTWYGLFKPVIGIDPASGETESSDDTAIVVAGEVVAFPYLSNYDHISGQKIAYKAQGMRCNVVVRSYIGKADIRNDAEDARRKKMDIVQILSVLCKLYKPQFIYIETGVGTQGLVLREVKRQLREQNITVPVNDWYPSGDKHARIKNTLLPIMQSAKVTIFQEEPTSYSIWHQLVHLGVAKKDDGADALHICATHFRKPPTKDYQQMVETAEYAREAVNDYHYDWEVH